MAANQLEAFVCDVCQTVYTSEDRLLACLNHHAHGEAVDLTPLNRMAAHDGGRGVSDRPSSYAPTARWPKWLRRLWRWAFRWEMYERGYVDGIADAESVLAQKEAEE